MVLRILDWGLCMIIIELADATPQFHSVAPYRFDYGFVDD
jgi:hypothetical protein